MIARVYITPRRDVLDPQGEAVELGLHGLGFRDVEQVRVGKYLELRLGEVPGADAEARVREMCEKLLANTLLEDYRFEIGPETNDTGGRSPGVR